MKKNNRSARHPAGAGAAFGAGRRGWARLGAGAALAWAIAAGWPLPAAAQDPAANQATLNFVGAEIESVVKAIGHYTGTTFIIDPRVKGTISVVSEKPVTKAEAYNLLTSALRLQGYAAVTAGGITKVVPEADAKLQAGPIQTGQVRGDQIATQVFRLDYESATNLVPVLRPLISPNNTINANPGSNSLVITDYADNLRRLGRIIAALDAPPTTEPEIIPVRYGIASDVAALTNRLLDGGGPTGGAPNAPGAADRIGVLADPRTNSIILRAQSPARANLAKSLIAKLDQPTSTPGNVHVVYLKNAEATRLAQTLRAVVAGESASATGQGNQPSQQLQQATSAFNQNQNQNQQGGQQVQPLQQQQQGPLPTGGPGGFIQADPATNTLIITASEAVYRNLRTVIDQLDARRAQVYVESLIVEITSDKAAEFGFQWAGLSGDSGSSYRVGGISSFSSGGNNLAQLGLALRAARADGSIPAVLPSNGLNLGIFRQIGGELGLGVLARALESEGNANILSMPNLITLDNDEARIIVGQNVPFVTGQFTTAASGGSSGVNPFQTIERKDVGLSLRVRPQISEGGTVKMQIYQETSSVQPGATVADLRTNKRSIETNVLVEDGDIIALGGLIEDTLTDNVEQVPGLGDIPVVGNLFKYQNRTRGKKNLMVFLRPTVIRTAEQGNSVTVNRYDYIRGQQFLSTPREHFALPPANTPVLPPLENGRPVGGGMVDVEPEARRPLYTLPPGAQPSAQPAQPAQPLPQEQPPQAPQPQAPAPQPMVQPPPTPPRPLHDWGITD